MVEKNNYMRSSWKLLAFQEQSPISLYSVVEVERTPENYFQTMNIRLSWNCFLR